MPDHGLIREILRQMLEAIGRIERRASGLTNPNDFMSSDEGIDKLDAICMMLVAIGESCKHLDRITQGQLFATRPEIDWKGVMGIHDIISHHYFDINADVVYSVCKNRIPELKTAFDSLHKIESEL